MDTSLELPGQDLVEQGLADLHAGRRTAPSLLVAMARERLAGVGVQVPEAAVSRPGHDLYDLLEAEDALAAHGRYNALLRRLVSYVRAAEHAAAR